MSDDNAATEQQQTQQPPDPTAWGQPISDERKAELDALFERQRAWVEQPVESRGEGVFKDVQLSGADVYWLAQRALAGPEADHLALEDVASRLQSTASLTRFSIDLSALHLEGAFLRGAHLEHANLCGAHLERANLRGAYLERAVLPGIHLEHAILSEAHLEDANLSKAHLEGAHLSEVYLEGAFLPEVHLESADLSRAQLERANLRGAHLEGANLRDAFLDGAHFDKARMEYASLFAVHAKGAHFDETHLEGADLTGSHLESADLFGAHLEGANLRGSWLDSTTALNKATMDDHTRLGDIQWSGVGAVNLTRLSWENVARLGDEQGIGLHASSGRHAATVRAYRQLAAQLRAQGLSEVADRFAYRAQIRQRYAYLHTLIEDWRHPWLLPGDLLRYLGSAALALLAGYGYRPGRTIILYLLFITCFAALFFAYGTGCHIGGPQDIAFILAQQVTHAPQGYACVTPPARPMSWNEAFVVSLTAFHGRGFLATDIKPGDPQAALAAAEAVLGLIIEISFIATFTQRFFGAK